MPAPRPRFGFSVRGLMIAVAMVALAIVPMHSWSRFKERERTLVELASSQAYKLQQTELRLSQKNHQLAVQATEAALARGEKVPEGTPAPARHVGHYFDNLASENRTLKARLCEMERQLATVNGGQPRPAPASEVPSPSPSR